jgi:hypothetical protein
MPFGAPIFTFKALDGGTYKTGIDQWNMQVLSDGSKVFTKLVFLGDKTKMIAIDQKQAIQSGVDQLYTKAEKARVLRSDHKPEMSFAEFQKAKRECEQIAAVREAALGGTASPKAKSRYPWASKETGRRTTTISEPVKTKQPPKAATKSHSTADMISEEAKNLSKKR